MISIIRNVQFIHSPCSGLAIDDFNIFEEFLTDENGIGEKELDNFLNESQPPDGSNLYILQGQFHKKVLVFTFIIMQFKILMAESVFTSGKRRRNYKGTFTSRSRSRATPMTTAEMCLPRPSLTSTSTRQLVSFVIQLSESIVFFI